MEVLLDWMSALVWGGDIRVMEEWPGLLIPLILLGGLYLTIRLRGIQFTKLVRGLKLGLITRKEEGAEGDISHFQALMTALAATIGNGNLAGVATAIFLGGPGAVFWMWMTGLVGICTKYAEAFLGVRFRVKAADGKQSGGPMTYLTEGVGGALGKFLGVFFAIAAAIAAFGIGNMVQSNSVATAIDSQFGLPTWLTGVVLTVLTGIVLFGGIKSIGRAASALVPTMGIFYVAAGLVVVVLNIADVPAALGLIFSDAFTGTAATGGFAGAAVRQAIQFGVARGMFSNESGLGTGGIAAAAAQTTNPVRQAMVSMTQTFIDTIIVCSVTAVVIISTGAWDSGETSTALTVLAFNEGLPGEWGGTVVVIASALFAYSTLLGWGYFGERSVERLAGVRTIIPYRILFVGAVYLGAVQEIEIVWTFSDVMNGLMAIPNMIGLFLLSGLIMRETREYFREPHEVG